MINSEAKTFLEINLSGQNFFIADLAFEDQTKIGGVFKLQSGLLLYILMRGVAQKRLKNTALDAYSTFNRNLVAVRFQEKKGCKSFECNAHNNMALLYSLKKSL